MDLIDPTCCTLVVRELEVQVRHSWQLASLTNRQACAKGGGAHAPPDFGRSEGAAGSGGAPHYYVPPTDF